MSRACLYSVLLVVLGLTGPANAETVTLATYNVEHFESHFRAHRLSKELSDAQKADPLLKDLLEEERRQNNEDNWEVAQVITDERFNPDVLVIQEGCSQSNLEYFNKRWLGGAYGTLVVFPTNTDREQHLGILLKPGFKLVERRDQYHREKDAAPNERGGLLFARGPAFCLIETPSGYRFWVGVTHQKSKSGDGVEVTAWRNREAARTHEIMLELQREGPADVVLLGDVNDEPGVAGFEADPKSGGDTVARLVGPPADGFVLVTEALARSGEASFGGYWNAEHRGFIDHVVATPSVKDQVEHVGVFRDSVARVASDHFPVYVKLRSDEPARAREQAPQSAGPAAPAPDRAPAPAKE